jgi:L-ribulose-5-phosphate 4-epimerase
VYFTPTAEKLIPDLTPREELVVLARALWREGYNDHLAGHITVNLGDGTLLCNPWLLTWAELQTPPRCCASTSTDGWSRGTGPCPSVSPCTSSCTASCARTWVGRAQPPALRHRVGRPGRDPRRSSTRAPPSAAAAGPGSTSTRGRSTTRRARGRRSRRWATRHMALLAGHGVFVLGGSARAVHQRAVALEQRCQHAWYARAAGRRRCVHVLPAGLSSTWWPERRRGLHRLLGSGGAGRAGGRPRPAGLTTNPTRSRRPR